jgi:hypothetical protein
MGKSINNTKKNREIPLATSKELGLEVNAEILYMYSCLIIRMQGKIIIKFR